MAWGMSVLADIGGAVTMIAGMIMVIGAPGATRSGRSGPSGAGMVRAGLAARRHRAGAARLQLGHRRVVRGRAVISRSHRIALAVLVLGVPPLVFGNPADLVTLVISVAVIGGSGVALLLVAVGMGARSTDVAERTRVVHVHAGDWDAAARHEAGHIGNTIALGGRVPRAYINQDGSGGAYCVLPWKATPAMDIAVSLAGGTREGVNPWTAPQCAGDRSLIAEAMRAVPDAERPAVRREAMRLRHRGLWSGRAAAAERKLRKDGKL